jgi:hypothetical protein
MNKCYWFPDVLASFWSSSAARRHTGTTMAYYFTVVSKGGVDMWCHSSTNARNANLCTIGDRTR